MTCLALFEPSLQPATTLIKSQHKLSDHLGNSAPRRRDDASSRSCILSRAGAAADFAEGVGLPEWCGTVGCDVLRVCASPCPSAGWVFLCCRHPAAARYATRQPPECQTAASPRNTGLSWFNKVDHLVIEMEENPFSKHGITLLVRCGAKPCGRAGIRRDRAFGCVPG